MSICADRLSISIGVGLTCSNPMVSSNARSQTASLHEKQAAMYSVSVDEVDTVACFFDIQEMRPLPKEKQYLDMDFRESGQFV